MFRDWGDVEGDHALVVWLVPRPRGGPPLPRPRFGNPPRPRWFKPPRPPVYPFPPYAPALGRRGSTYMGSPETWWGLAAAAA